jgi:hypothetical protein
LSNQTLILHLLEIYWLLQLLTVWSCNNDITSHSIKPFHLLLTTSITNMLIADRGSSRASEKSRSNKLGSGSTNLDPSCILACTSSYKIFYIFIILPEHTPLNGSPRQNGLLRVFWRGPPHIRDNNYLSPIHVYPDKSHITFYHGGRSCYFGHHHRTEAPSTTKAPKTSRVHSIVP